MLITLKLVLSNGREQLYSRELEADAASLEPRAILERTSEDGRVALGDRESCSLESIVNVELVHPEPREGPTLEHGIHDEDVAAALKGNYEQR
jgi:hypothetical protein